MEAVHEIKVTLQRGLAAEHWNCMSTAGVTFHNPDAVYAIHASKQCHHNRINISK
jgi:hypothetical protein